MDAWRTVNPRGDKRVIVTRRLPGERWLEMLTAADCRIDYRDSDEPVGVGEIKEAMGDDCQGAIGQLTEPWGEELFAALARAGGTAYSNYAVGFDNVDPEAATRHGIRVGNTPGVLTEATAELAAGLTLAAARRLAEGDRHTREGRFRLWLPGLMIGRMLRGLTLGVIGAGRIGTAYARMMVRGFNMNLLYFNRQPNTDLEQEMADYSRFLESGDQPGISCARAESVDDLLTRADVVSLHTVLNDETRHLIDARRLALMKPDALLVNTGRGPLIDEAALVAHLRGHPDFRVGLDVYEAEPKLEPGLAELDNTVLVPHIGSATTFARQGMAALAAANVAGLLAGWPLWPGGDPGVFLEPDWPRAIASLIN